MPSTTPKKSSKPHGASAAPVSLRFTLSPALQKRLFATLSALEQAANPEDHRDALATLVEALTEGGMDYYFLRALSAAKVGFVVEQSARFGMSGAVKLLSSVSCQLIGRMDGPQLLIVAGYLRELMQ